MSPPRKILLCIDDSDASEDAVEWAMQHIYIPGDEVHLVRVRVKALPIYASPLLVLLTSYPKP